MNSCSTPVSHPPASYSSWHSLAPPPPPPPPATTTLHLPMVADPSPNLSTTVSQTTSSSRKPSCNKCKERGERVFRKGKLLSNTLIKRKSLPPRHHDLNLSPLPISSTLTVLPTPNTKPQNPSPLPPSLPPSLPPQKPPNMRHQCRWAANTPSHLPQNLAGLL